MQFVANGPDIPDTLLQAHEEGRVVFFCGAGISYPAGLPGFKGLVDEIYRILGTKPEPIEQVACDRSQFDVTLGLLERRFPGQRIEVRRALATALKPNLRRKGATITRRETMRLLVLQGANLSPEAKAELEATQQSVEPVFPPLSWVRHVPCIRMRSILIVGSCWWIARSGYISPSFEKVRAN